MFPSGTGTCSGSPTARSSSTGTSWPPSRTPCPTTTACSDRRTRRAMTRAESVDFPPMYRDRAVAVPAGGHRDGGWSAADVRLRAGVRPHQRRHVGGLVEGVRVEAARRERRSVGVLLPGGVDHDAAALLQLRGGVVVVGVLHVVEVAVLEHHLGGAAGVVAVAGDVVQVVVVEVGVGDVVGAGVADAVVVDPVVVQGHPGGDVGGPADPEGLVLAGQHVPGHGEVAGVLSGVDQAVVHPFDPVVVDPDVVGGVHLDAVVVVDLVVRVVGGHRRVADGEVADDDVVHAGLEDDAAVHQLALGAHPDQGLARGHRDLEADDRIGDVCGDPDDVRRGRGGVLEQVRVGGHGDGGAGGAAGGAATGGGEPVGLVGRDLRGGDRRGGGTGSRRVPAVGACQVLGRGVVGGLGVGQLGAVGRARGAGEGAAVFEVAGLLPGRGPLVRP